MTTNLELPIARVDVPASLVDSISFPAAGNFAQLVQPDIILMTLMIAVIASAETLLSAAAVDRMHDGERTRFNKELFAQGVGNGLCGLLGALPITGVIVRSSANIKPELARAPRQYYMAFGSWRWWRFYRACWEWCR